jgi:hypothetical protein
MRSLHTEIDIAAPAQRVWDLLTDLAAYPAWNPFIREAEGAVQEGSRLHVRLAPPGGRSMTFKPVLTRVVPARELRWQGHLLVPGLFDGEHIFEIQPERPGHVRFVQREQFGGLLLPVVWGGMEASTRRGFEAMNAALKQRAEAGGGAGP